MSRSCVLITLATVLTAATSGVSRAENVAPGVTFTTYNLSGPRVVYVVAIERERGEYKLKVGWPQKKRNFTARAAVSTIAGLYDTPPTHDVLSPPSNASFFSTAPAITGAAASDGEMLEQPVGGYETFLFEPVAAAGHRRGHRTRKRAPSPLPTARQLRSTATTRRATPTRSSPTRPNGARRPPRRLEGVEVVLDDVTLPHAQ